MRSARFASLFFLLTVLLAPTLQGGSGGCPHERLYRSRADGAEAPRCTFTAGSPEQLLIEIHKRPVPALHALPAGAGVVRAEGMGPALRSGREPSAPAVPLYLQNESLLI